MFLAGLDRLPETILDALLGASAGIEMVGDMDVDPEALIGGPESTNPQALFTQLCELDPDVVVLGIGGGLELDAVRRLLATRVLLLAVRGKQLLYCRVEPEAREVEEVSAAQLVSLIRDARGR